MMATQGLRRSGCGCGESVATIPIVDPPHRLESRWPIEGWPRGDAPPTLMTFTPEPVADGTRLRLVESGFTQVADGPSLSVRKANSQGWDAELGGLESHLNAAI
ncbi:SRPBCC domain-containing protein [Spirillospora sp. NPDC127200]